MVSDHARRKGIALSSNMDATVVKMRGDTRRLCQILINLLSNAVKFTQEGGSVGLDVSRTEDRGAIRFTVWDTGIGISEADAKNLFQPFVQVENGMGTHLGGTGLGLSLVKRLAELHHGTVALDSIPGEGSRFHVIIPLDTQISGQSSPETRVEAPSGELVLPQGLKVLIVEDNAANTNLLTHFLKPQGCVISYAIDGRQALAQVKKSRPDVVLMDVQMPVMDGIEATRRLKIDSATAGIPVVMLTAHAMSGDQERGMQVGADAYVTKPIELPLLLASIARLVTRR
jgi:CheY-like chemotaxis protein